jgi:peptide/nickel transport system ATP-binding protein
VTAPLLEVRDLECSYRSLGPGRLLSRPRVQRVVHGVSLSLDPGETVGLVGESGSGKTTIARAIAGLVVPTGGRILFEGRPLPPSVDRRPRDLHRAIQLVFQNPDSSLNPRRRVGSLLARPLELFFGLPRQDRRRRVAELLQDVHLDPGYARRFPTQLSGGERQRVAIAQALAADPKLILCDEVVSALDVSVQAGILNLLRELQARRGLAYLFITHDLAVVRWLAHRVVVLYRGRVMEVGTAAEVFSPPVHPYTEMLLRSVPDPSRRLLVAEAGAAASLDRGPSPGGCPFAGACPRYLGPKCDEVAPPWRRLTESHWMRCHIPPPDLAGAQLSLWEGARARRRGPRPGPTAGPWPRAATAAGGGAQPGGPPSPGPRS